jgi:putative PIN family toxin of toxin-antitoxin system
MRIVIDTDVVISAMRSPTGASAALLREVAEGRVTMLLNVPLSTEYEAKCTAAEHVLAAGLSREKAQVFVETLIGLAEGVQSYFLWRPLLRDPDDEMVLEAAVNGRADAIVSFNHKDFGNVPASFGIAVLKPHEALRSLRHEQQ